MKTISPLVLAILFSCWINKSNGQSSLDIPVKNSATADKNQFQFSRNI